MRWVQLTNWRDQLWHQVFLAVPATVSTWQVVASRCMVSCLVAVWLYDLEGSWCGSRIILSMACFEASLNIARCFRKKGLVESSGVSETPDIHQSRLDRAFLIQHCSKEFVWYEGIDRDFAKETSEASKTHPIMAYGQRGKDWRASPFFAPAARLRRLPAVLLQAWTPDILLHKGGLDNPGCGYKWEDAFWICLKWYRIYDIF